MEFINEKQLVDSITKGLNTAVTFVMEEIKDTNEKLIDDMVYGAYDPTWYGRTGEFGNAWDKDVSSLSGYVEGNFFYNSNGMTVNQEYGVHANVSDGMPTTGYLPDILYEAGKIGCIPHPTKRNAWKALDNYLSNSMMRSMFETGLGRSGLPWERGHGRITKDKIKGATNSQNKANFKSTYGYSGRGKNKVSNMKWF